MLKYRTKLKASYDCKRFFKRFNRLKFDQYIFPLESIIKNKNKLLKLSNLTYSEIKKYNGYNSYIDQSESYIAAQTVIKNYLLKKQKIDALDNLYKMNYIKYGHHFITTFHFAILSILKNNIEDLLSYQNDIILGYSLTNLKHLSPAKIYGILLKNPNATYFILKNSIDVKRAKKTFIGELCLIEKDIIKILKLIS